MSEEGRRWPWFIRALIVLAVATAAIGALLPMFVKSPPYPRGVPAHARSVLDRLSGR